MHEAQSRLQRLRQAAQLTPRGVGDEVSKLRPTGSSPMQFPLQNQLAKF